MLRWVFCMQIRFNSLALCRLNNFACFSVFYSNRNEKNISHNSDLVRESFFVLTDDPIFFRRRQWKLLLGSSLACVRTFRKQKVLKTLNFEAHKQLSVIECGIIIAKTLQTSESKASCSPENVFVEQNIFEDAISQQSSAGIHTLTFVNDSMTPSSASPQNKVAKHDFCQAAFKSLTVWPLRRYATQPLPWKSDLWFQISQFEVNLFMFQAFNIKFVLKWFIKSVPGVSQTQRLGL